MSCPMSGAKVPITSERRSRQIPPPVNSGRKCFITFSIRNRDMPRIPDGAAKGAREQPSTCSEFDLSMDATIGSPCHSRQNGLTGKARDDGTGARDVVARPYVETSGGEAASATGRNDLVGWRRDVQRVVPGLAPRAPLRRYPSRRDDSHCEEPSLVTRRLRITNIPAMRIQRGLL